jgi:hypothetical protein
MGFMAEKSRPVCKLTKGRPIEGFCQSLMMRRESLVNLQAISPATKIINILPCGCAIYKQNLLKNV